MSSTQTPLGLSSQDVAVQSIRSIAQPSTSRKKYSSYRRTPGSRRIEAAERVYPRSPGDAETDDQDLPRFTGLISTTWHTYKITPLYKFKAEVSYLKKYGRLLAAFIEAERKKGDAVDVEGESADRVEMSLYHGLQVTQDDPVAVQILMRAQNKNGTGAMKTVLTAYLMGVEMEEKLDPHLQQAFVHYPVALVRGPVALTRYLFDWLRSHFDCSASRLMFSSLDLSWILAMWCGKEGARSSKPVELIYSVPPECEGLDKITMTIDPEDCRGIWSCIHDPGHQDVTADEVAALASCLENHFYQHFKIKLTAMQLVSVGTALAFVGSEGKVKLFSGDNALLILRHLTCLAMEQLGTYQQ